MSARIDGQRSRGPTPYSGGGPDRRRLGQLDGDRRVRPGEAGGQVGGRARAAAAAKYFVTCVCELLGDVVGRTCDPNYDDA